MSTPTVVAPFGSGAPATGVAPPTRPITGARFIDPITKDYVYDEEGAYQRMPTTRQRVLLAVTHEWQSSSVLPDGIRLPKRMGDSWEQRARIETERVLQPMIRDGSLKLLSVTAERTAPAGRALITISYIDQALGQRDSVEVAK